MHTNIIETILIEVFLLKKTTTTTKIAVNMKQKTVIYTHMRN